MIPAEARDCSFFENIWTGPEAHPASYSAGRKGTFLGGKSGRGMRQNTHHHPVPRLRMNGTMYPLPH